MEKLEKKIKEMKIELLRLKGQYGNCEKCNEERPLNKRKLCWDCDYERRKEFVRTQYEHLIGKKIIDIEVGANDYSPDLYAIILEDKTRISVDAWSDPLSLDVEDS